MKKAPPADDPVGRAQWRRIAATVKPLGKPSGKRAVKLAQNHTLAPADISAALLGKAEKPRAVPQAPVIALPAPKAASRALSANTLDASWDRSIRAGRIEVDFTIDLHGHNLASAHTHLSRALDRAVASGARVILLIAGKSRGPDEAPRGAIRRELESWLAHSRHAARIAAVRNAHPRHGGAGALYLVLRRPRD